MTDNTIRQIARTKTVLDGSESFEGQDGTGGFQATGATLLKPANPITYTGDATGLSLVIEPGGLEQNGIFVSGPLVRHGTQTANGLLTLNLGAAVIYDETGVLTATSLTTFTANSLVGTVNAWNPTGLSAIANLSLGAMVQSFPGFEAWFNTNTSLVSFSAPVWTATDGEFSPTMAGLTSVDLSGLVTTAGLFHPVWNALTAIAFPALTTASDWYPTINSVTSLALPRFTFGGLGLNAASLTSFSLPVWAHDNDIGFQCHLPSLATALNFPAMTHMGGTFGFGDIALLPSVSLPLIVNFDGGVNETSALNLTAFTMGATLKSMGAAGAASFLLTGTKLTQAAVDSILVRLAALDGTGGTTPFVNAAVDLSGGTAAAPSATGLTAKATLVGRGCTVTTN